jgi:hypothetical protein
VQAIAQAMLRALTAYEIYRAVEQQTKDIQRPKPTPAPQISGPQVPISPPEYFENRADGPGARSTSTGATEASVRVEKPRMQLHHYTDRKGYEGILASGRINPSLPPELGGRNRDARLGAGVYLTDIYPRSMKNEDLSRLLFGNTGQTNRVGYFITIDTTGLNIFRSKERPNIFVARTLDALPIQDRIRRSGENSDPKTRVYE